MLKNFSFFVYSILKLINKLFFFFTNRNFIPWINYFINFDSNKIVTIKGKKVFFFTPNNLTEWRVRTFVEKEPDTIEWINNFKTKQKIIFWDIGANIGTYSIYASIVHNNKIETLTEYFFSYLHCIGRDGGSRITSTQFSIYYK